MGAQYAPSATSQSAIQDALLKDPKVQAEIQKASHDALNDPAVQNALMQAFQEKFPEYAAQARDHILAWARDPDVQARAKQYAGVALGFAADAGNQIMKRIEQGPVGVRLLAFAAGVGSCTNSVLSLIEIKTLLAGHLILYMIAVYQLVFSLTTMLFEAPPEWIQNVQATIALPIDSYHDMLIENCRFLSLSGGRGMFYIFQGTLWLAFATLKNPVTLAVGCFLIFIGALHVMMYCCIMPQTVAAKMRDGYAAVATHDVI